jgi:hypothetical protein
MKKILAILTIIFITGVGVGHTAGAKREISQGSFFGIGEGHEVSGKASVISKNGKYYVKLHKDFMTTSGPDLHVLLHKEVQPTSYTGSNYVDLGLLPSDMGAQYFEIPEDVEIDDFKAVIIWCRRFNATFGSAPQMKVNE